MPNTYKISTGETHSLLIYDGNLYSIGDNSRGQLGLGSQITSTGTFSLISNSGNWTDVSAGKDFSLGICGGYLYSWGDNTHGQLGLSYSGYYGFQYLDFSAIPYDFRKNAVQDAKKYTPQKVEGFNNWTKVAAGVKHSLGIMNGYLYAWGSNGGVKFCSGALGIKISGVSPDGNMENDGNIQKPPCPDGSDPDYFGSSQFAYLTLGVNTPIKITTNNTWTHISAGDNLSAGISGGCLYTWGINPNNCAVLGRGYELPAIQTLVTINRGFFINYFRPEITTACKTNSSYYYKYSNFLNIFESSRNDVYGLSLWDHSSSSNKIGNNNTWSDVSIFKNHCLGISGDHLYAWGTNRSGQLGNNSTITITTPTLINNTKKWYKVSAGFDSSAGLELVAEEFLFPYMWGNNTKGQLGLGDVSTRKTPENLTQFTDVKDIDISFETTGLLNTDVDGIVKLYQFGTLQESPPTQQSEITDANEFIPNKYKTPNNLITSINSGLKSAWITLLNNKSSTPPITNLDTISFYGPNLVSDSVLSQLNLDDIGTYSRITQIAPGHGSPLVVRSNKTTNLTNSYMGKNMSPRAWQKLNRGDPVSKVYNFGDTHLGIIFSDGTLETWSTYKDPTNYQTMSLDWKDAKTGKKHFVILTNNNRVLCFGDNTYGQCDVPSGLTGIKSIFATEYASGAVKNNGEVIHWGNTVELDLISDLDKEKYRKSNPETTITLPKNRTYKHNLIGYTFDGEWGESLFKNAIKEKIQDYYNQIGDYPNKIILNIQDEEINPLRWFNEPAKIKYLGFTLNSAGISAPNDGVTYQNVIVSNYSVAPTREEDFNKVLQKITNFYSLGYTLAKQAILETTGNKNNIAVGFNTGQLLPEYTLLGFSGIYGGGYTFNYKLSWGTGLSLLQYNEYTNDDEWTPYLIQGPDSYLPVDGFDVSVKSYKPYSGTTASNSYYIRSIGVTSAVYTTYYDRWKQFLNNVNYDFVIDNNISKFILPEELSNTPLIWSKTKQIFKDYENSTGINLNKNILTSFSHTQDSNIGITLDATNKGPILVEGITGVYINLSQFFETINISRSSNYNYNTSINDLNIFDNSISAIQGNTFDQIALNQWYYYGVNGGTFTWSNHEMDSGYTYINWTKLTNELTNKDYTVFDSGNTNVSKLVNLFDYFNSLNVVPNQLFDFYNLKDIVKIKSGKDHSILLNKSGNVYFLGSTLDNRQDIPQGTYTYVSAGDRHSAAIDSTGTLFTAGKIITDSGGCSGSTLTVDLTPISGTFDTVESGGNHLALFEIGENKKYLGRVDKVDDVFKRIYLKAYTSPDDTAISFTDPSGTNVSIVRDGAIIKNIQHKLLSIDSYINSVQYIVNSAGTVQDPAANGGAVWKSTFINNYKSASGNDLLITPYKVQQNEIKVMDIKYLNNNKLYDFEKQFKNLVQTENKIDIRITKL
jgi:alpha-tubulin suppressor-like RCC1 family protein